MRSFFATLTQLRIPLGAGPNGAQIIIGQSGSDVYPELATLYAPGVVVGAIIQQETRFDYIYLAYVNPTVGRSFWAVGGMESVSLILREAFRVAPGGLGAVPDFTIAGRTNIITTGQSADWSVDSVSQGRGLRAWIASLAATAGIAAEAVVLTAGAFSWITGRAYRVTFGTLVTDTVASDTVFFQIRRTGLGGAILGTEAFATHAVVGQPTTCKGEVFIRSTATVTDNVVLTLQAAGGVVTGIAGGNFIRYLKVEDAGAAADYPNAIAF